MSSPPGYDAGSPQLEAKNGSPILHNITPKEGHHNQIPLRLNSDTSSLESIVGLGNPLLHRRKSEKSDGRLTQSLRRRCWKWRPSRTTVFGMLTVNIILCLGIIIWFAILTNYLRRFSHKSDPQNGIARFISNISLTVPILTSLESVQPFPDDFTRDISPIACHSHNDYWRHVPLLDAISAGCTSVEADIWTSTGRSGIQNTTELYIGHSSGSLRSERTFGNLYIEPLVYILDQTNTGRSSPDPKSGIFEVNPNATMVLLVDFKVSDSESNVWSLFQDHLQPLREKGYLTYWNETTQERIMGPVTIVATGDSTVDLITNTTSNPHQDIFFDAPLLDLEKDAASSSSKYTTATSYYASVDLSKAVGKVFSSLTDSQLKKIAKQTSAANIAGLISRYWDTPSWPVSVRNKVWEQLNEQGASILNVDELWTATKKDWRFCSYVGWGLCP